MPDGVSEILRFADGWGRRAYPVRWTLRDVITYAIATGADGRNGRELVWESAPGFRVLPTFATRFAHQPLVDFASGVQDAGLPSFARAARVHLHRPLPLECDEAYASVTLGIKERSTERVVLTLDLETGLADEPVAQSSLDVYFRLPGRRSPRRSTPVGEIDKAGPVVEVKESVRPYQAAVFRTLLEPTPDGGLQDAMHIDPGQARELGLPAPTLPGEVTLGIVARLATQNSEPLGIHDLVGAEVTYLRPVWDVDQLAITFAPSRDNSVRTQVINGDGHVAVRGALHFGEPHFGAPHLQEET